MNSVKILCWNANGLTPRKNELQLVLDFNHVDICLVSETHFTKESYLRLKGYKCYHAVHPSNNARGGSAVIIKENLYHHEHIKIETEAFQICAIEVKMKSFSLNVASLYCPPRHSTTFEEYREIFSLLGNRFILGGDFNAKNTAWGSRLTSDKGRRLYQAIVADNCEAHSTGKPTYWPTDLNKKPDLIDFFITRNISANYLLVEENDDLSSDHSPIVLTLSDRIIQRPHNPVLANHKTNWEGFKQDICKRVELAIPLQTQEDVDREVEHLVCTIQTVVWEHSPIIKRRLRGINYPREIVLAIKEKRKARKRWQATRAPCHKEEWYRAASELKALIQEINEETHEHFITELTSHRDTDYSLWKATKYLKRPTAIAQPIIDANGKWAKSNQSKADTFADHLANIFTPHLATTDDLPLEDATPVHQEVGIPNVTIREVQRTISAEINPRKAPGYDLITGQILKHLPRKVIAKIAMIINAAFRLRYVPQLWKIAEVIMIAKPGKPPEKPESYRPISLLPVLSKLFEKLIHKRLLPILEKRRLIPQHQFGFRQNHSTIDQVHRITHIIEEALENKKVCSAIFLDVSQAFDKVWHEGLNYKLRKTLPKQYAELLQSYLTNRYFRIKHEDAFSEPKLIKAGVPQGSVLGPLLYVLYTGDLPEIEKNTTATFADDTAVLAVGENNIESLRKLNRSISSIQQWAAKWRIKMNEAKSVHVDFTNKRIDYLPVYLNGKVIPHANEAKYLGITLDARLRWRAHVKKKKEELLIKFRKMNWLMGRRSKLSIQNKLTLYNQVLKPVWTYGAQLWGCTAQSNREIIQRFQNSVLRSVVNAPWYFRNERLHHELRIETVNEAIKRQAVSHLRRLRSHVNEEAARLLDASEVTRRLKRTKPLELAYS